jgi:nicotinic acid mononucleotide adenylyltransferase
VFDMSSTDIRARIQNGEDISDLVPQEVADYMQNNLVLRTKY